MQEQVSNMEGNADHKAGSQETLLVASKVREVIRGYNCNTAGDALDGLNSYLHWLIQQAAKRAEANGRKTIRAHDFICQ